VFGVFGVLCVLCVLDVLLKDLGYSLKRGDFILRIGDTGRLAVARAD